MYLYKRNPRQLRSKTGFSTEIIMFLLDCNRRVTLSTNKAGHILHTLFNREVL